ncbi:hypothetical protein KHA80_00440 [Anaerobacillus sp. HL2]|nr:hypothetical protein KHA80_00440 [Anaerobacillus sp. HL2]
MELQYKIIFEEVVLTLNLASRYAPNNGNNPATAKPKIQKNMYNILKKEGATPKVTISAKSLALFLKKPAFNILATLPSMLSSIIPINIRIAAFLNCHLPQNQ